jgi:hypothetical protein
MADILQKFHKSITFAVEVTVNKIDIKWGNE